MKNKVLLTILLLFISVVSFSQSVKLVGKIVDEKNATPIEYATIRVIKNNVVAISNSKGEFALNAEIGDKIEVSHISYKTVIASLQNQITIPLQLTQIELNEIIVAANPLQDISQSMSFIVQNGYSHVNNNHKQLKFNQTRDLKSIELNVLELFNNIVVVFNTKDFKNIDTILAEKDVTLNKISDLIQKQIERIRTTENSPKNSKLYFALLVIKRKLGQPDQPPQ